MSEKSVEYTNPENLSIELVTLTITNGGVVQKIKALDQYWVEERELSVYEKLPSGSNLVLGAVEAWINRMQAYLQDLEWLLGLEYYRFWSTILYHPQCMDSLVSFLQEANPPYLSPHQNKDAQKLYKDIRRLVFITFCRLITNKEAKTQWMSKEVMAEILYDNFIFTIPIIWDICLVYGGDNPQHVSRLLTSLFTLQPRYQQDVKQAVDFVIEAFKYMILQVNKDYDCDEPPNLPETFKGFSEIRRPADQVKAPEKVTYELLQDIVVHLLDICMTLRIFVQVYPKCVNTMRKTNFVLSVVQLYEYGIPKLYSKLEEVGDKSDESYGQLESYIESARVELIDVFRDILAAYKNAIFNEEGNISSNVESYLSVMMEGLSEKLLIQDYHACYPVHEDLEMLKQVHPNIDSVKTDFILQAIYSNMEEDQQEASGNQAAALNGHYERLDNRQLDHRLQDHRPLDNEVIDNKIPNKIREESLISEVMDILPHLGSGFILKCLQYYEFDAEKVVNSILEDTLADSLRKIDKSLPIIPDDVLDQKFLETGIERLNVFDGDEFDIMNRDDVDVSKIHVGKKKSKYRNINDMLNDKSDVKKLSDIYTKYNLVCDSEAMYSDEYDDTYDSDGAGAGAADGDDLGRPFVTPRALQVHRREEESEEESDREEEDVNKAGSSSGNNRSKVDFCVNPEEVRARREAAYRARGGRSLKPTQNSHRNADVIGKPKGHGQEKDVVVNRERKEKNKSARGNHSRRQGAQWKRSQGMMPS